MSVVSCLEIPAGRGGSSQGAFSSEVVRAFRVSTNNSADDESVIYGSGLLPNYLDPHPRNGFFLARSVTLEQQGEGAFWWIAKITYKTVPVPQYIRDVEEFEDPLERPVRISGEAASFTKPATQWRLIGSRLVTDTPGNPLLDTYVPLTNSAGCPFDSVPEIDDSRWVLHFRKNYDIPPPEWMFDLNNCTNLAPTVVIGRFCDVRTLKVTGMRFGEEQEHNGVHFCELSWQVHYRREGWVLSIPDKGFQYLKTPGDLTTITEITLPSTGGSAGLAPSTAQFLDGNGGLLTSRNWNDSFVIDGAVYGEEDISFLPLNYGD